MWRAFGFVIVLGALILPLTFANATSSPPFTTPPRGEATHTSAATRASGVLRLAMPDVSPQVDPALVIDEENVELANLLYMGLVRLNASYQPVPAAAARYTVSPDHKTYTFYLRKGLRFSNGDPVTADDFAYSINRSLSPALKSASAPTYLLDIAGAPKVLAGKAKTVSGVKVINATTIQITTRWPVPYFLMELTYPTSFALDAERLSKLGSIDSSAWYTNPIGSGPYRLKSWTPNSQMVLVPNRYYVGTRPSLKEITLALGAIPPTDVYSYVTQNLDVVNLPNQPSLWHRTGIKQTAALAIDGLYMSDNTKPLDNLNVRIALTESLDRSKLVTQAWGSAVTPFAGYVPPGESGYDEQLKPLPYNVTAAQAALKAAGYPDGAKFPTMTLYYPGDVGDPPQLAKLAQEVSKAWRKNLHITIHTTGLNLPAMDHGTQSNSLPLYISGWSANFPDPHDWLSGQWKSDAINNNVHYDSKKFDTLVETADVTWNYAQRMNLYDQAQQALVDDAAWIPMFIPHRLAYIRPAVTNLLLTGYGLIPRSGNWADVGFRAAGGAGIKVGDGVQ